jgi:DNA-binding response OmpR family regulator
MIRAYKDGRMSANILIVEDESIVAMEIEEYLMDEGYRVEKICADAACAFETATTREVDLILMDISLIESNGIEASKRIKAVKDLPIIFLTSYIDIATIDNAIETEPVAYLTKPFNQRELLASIKIGLRRSTLSSTDNVLIQLDHEFSFHTIHAELLHNDQPVSLNKKERDLLLLFLERPNQLLSYELIEHTVWPEYPTNDNARRILMSRLRNKLKHRFIATHAKEGYVFKIA